MAKLGLLGAPPKRDLVGVDWWLPWGLTDLQGGSCQGRLFRYCWVGFGPDAESSNMALVYILQYTFALDVIEHID